MATPTTSTPTPTLTSTTPDPTGIYAWGKNGAQGILLVVALVAIGFYCKASLPSMGPIPWPSIDTGFWGPVIMGILIVLTIIQWMFGWKLMWLVVASATAITWYALAHPGMWQRLHSPRADTVEVADKRPVVGVFKLRPNDGGPELSMNMHSWEQNVRFSYEDTLDGQLVFTKSTATELDYVEHGRTKNRTFEDETVFSWSAPDMKKTGFVILSPLGKSHRTFCGEMFRHENRTLYKVGEVTVTLR